MKKWLNTGGEVKMLQKQFDQISIVQIPQGNNNHAYPLATLAFSIACPTPLIITVESLSQLSIHHLNGT